jgi:hypothetical protein
MRLVHNRLSHATGQSLPQGPDGLTHLASGRCDLGQRCLSLVEPPIKALMQLLA